MCNTYCEFLIIKYEDYEHIAHNFIIERRIKKNFLREAFPGLAHMRE